MALFGNDVALVSLGIGCSVTHQLESQLSLLSELVGEPLVKHATPFDWLLCGPSDVAAMLEDGDFEPINVQEFKSRYKGPGWRRPHWPKRNCWFWHDVFVDPNEFYMKRAHMEDSFYSIHNRKRKVFFLSDAANNLVSKAEEIGGFEAKLRPEAIIRLDQALWKIFGEHELMVVSYFPPSGFPLNIGFRQMRRGGPQWQGDAIQWGRLFFEMFHAKV